MWFLAEFCKSAYAKAKEIDISLKEIPSISEKNVFELASTKAKAKESLKSFIKKNIDKLTTI